MYSEPEAVLNMFKEDMLNTIIGEDYIEDLEERKQLFLAIAEEAIQDADAEIDGYLAKRYPVPFTTVPKVITKFSKDIAAYNLASRQGIDESERDKTYLTRYNSAISFLSKMATGIIEIGIEESLNGTSLTNQGISLQYSKRLFSRKSMKGW